MRQPKLKPNGQTQGVVVSILGITFGLLLCLFVSFINPAFVPFLLVGAVALHIDS